DQFANLRHPTTKASLEGLWVQPVENALERIVRRHAIGQFQKALEPRLPFSCEERDVSPAITISDHAANCHNKDVHQQMPRPPLDTRIPQLAKMSLDRPHAASGHTSLLVPGS